MPKRERARTSIRTACLLGTLAAALAVAPAALADYGPYVYEGHEYWVLTSCRTWQGAEDEAVARGGHLVSIADAAENSFVNTILPWNGGWWTGLGDQASEGTWVWSNGDPGSYLNWNQPYEPNGGTGENCVEMLRGDGGSWDGRWNDLPCNRCIGAVIELDAPTTTAVTLVLEAYEDSWGSCPWLYPWTGTDFTEDNDIYPTARGAEKETTDYYTLANAMVPKDGFYVMEVRGIDSETSYTDFVSLVLVDHPAGLTARSDDLGNVTAYGELSVPTAATSGDGQDVLTDVSAADDAGFRAFDGDSVELDFSGIDLSQGAILILGARGFLADDDPGDSLGKPANIEIQTLEAGQWVTRHEFKPRFKTATNAYDLSAWLGSDPRVRLFSTSCNTLVYSLIDYAAIYGGAPGAVEFTTLQPLGATHSDGTDVTADLLQADGTHAVLDMGEAIELTFDAPPVPDGWVRAFVVQARGYYVPAEEGGTYYIYTWDGSAWRQRLSTSMRGAEMTRRFDMDAWLPDVDDEFKVRIYQNYRYARAYIDFVGMEYNGEAGPLEYARDLYGTDLTAMLAASDNWRRYYSRYTNRWVEAKWAINVNTPPVADAGPNLAIITEEQASTVLQGTATDADDDPLLYRWVEDSSALTDWLDVGPAGEAYLDLGTLPDMSIGEHTLTLEVDDGTDLASDSMQLAVANSAPHVAPIGAGTYQLGSPVTVSGQVSDYDGDLVTCDWLEGSTLLFTDEIATIYGGDPVDLVPHDVWDLALGTHILTLRATDAAGNVTSADITVEIIDTTAPTLAPVFSEGILWPPNHRMVDITVDCNASDNSGVVYLSAVITCNEPPDGLGDGDLAPDFTEPLVDDENGTMTFQLRAERSGKGDGRIYTIEITARDPSDNVSTATLEILVPHDKRKK